MRISSHLFLLLAGSIMVLNIFLRFYQLESRMQFNYDQVENAWMMKNMRINGEMPLLGMQAKGNSGFYIGPLYYYMLYPFYFFSDLDPIASGVFAGVVSAITCIALMICARSIFNTSTSLITGFIFTVSASVIHFDRMAWPVVLIPIVSLLTYYFLLRVLDGNPKFLIPLGIVTGFSFHIHFTAIFLPIIIFCCLPFFKYSKVTFFYGIIALFCFAAFFLPMIVANNLHKGIYSNNILSYAGTYFNGIHLRRMIQLLPDDFLQFSNVLFARLAFLDFLKFIFLPVFCGLIIFTKQKYRKYIVYVTILFFVVPLVVLSTYKGELTDYYYLVQRPVVAIIIGFIFSFILHKHFLGKLAVSGFLFIFTILNLQIFAEGGTAALSTYRARAIGAVNGNRYYPFVQGDQVSYLYNFYLYRKNRHWPTQ